MKLRMLKFCALLLCALAAPVWAQTTAKSNSQERNQSMTGEIVLKKVGQIAVRVKDVARAAAFYRDTLGMKLQLQQPNLAVLDCGGVTIFLTPPENAVEAGHNSIIYFEVDDIQQTAKSLAARGVTIVEKPNEVGKLGTVSVWIAIFRDSEENLMGLRSMVAEKK